MPKQFIGLLGKPLLVHTLQKFFSWNPGMETVVVLPADFTGHFETLRRLYFSSQQIRVLAGGNTRQDSVRIGLDSFTGHGLVAVHDAARPFVSTTLIDRCFKEAAQYGNCVPGIIPKDAVRRFTEPGNSAIPREQIRLMQTPQVFELAQLRKAFMLAGQTSYPDEASLLEAAGIPIHITAGEEDNFKITTPLDLRLAEFLLQQDS